MGIFENVYQRMMTYDRTALAIVITFYATIWTILNIKLYKQLLDIDFSKKRKTIWFFLEVISISFGKIMFPASVYKIVNLALFPIITNLVLKVKMERCLVLQLIDYIAMDSFSYCYHFLCYYMDNFKYKIIQTIIGY